MSTHTPPSGGDPGHPSPVADAAPPGHATVPVRAVPAPRSASQGAAGVVVGGRYNLLSPIGTGGMGTVWRANDQLLRREVAVKEVVLPPGMPQDEQDALTERTLREARAAAALSHPSVVRVFDVVIDGGRPWIVMELLKAHSLADLIDRDGGLAPRAVAKIGLAMLGALEAAHNAGVLHRDVKPGNVLICADGRCVLTDFGVARSARDAQMTTPGMVLGSPHFISPERATGGQFGPPSDLFSLGVTLYAAAEGRPPFDRGDAIGTMHAVVNEAPEPPQRAGELTQVLYGLLEKDPANRWDVQRTRDSLRSLLMGSGRNAGTDNGAATPTATTRMPVAPAQPTGTPSPTSVPAVGPQPAPAHQPAAGHQPAVPDQPAGPPVPAQPWRARASVPSPAPASPAATGQPYPGPAAGHATTAPAYPEPVYPARSGISGAWLFGAAAVLIALGLMLTGVGVVSGWFGPGTDTPAPGKNGPAPATGPGFDVTTYRGKGLSLHVPADWKRRDAGTYVQFHDPKDRTAWLRINVPSDRRPANRILRAADQRFRKGCCGLTNYRRQGPIRSRKLAGHGGAQLEYLADNARTGQRRHGIWRMIVVDGRNYQVYMSVPAGKFKQYRKVFHEAARSMKLT